MIRLKNEYIELILSEHIGTSIVGMKININGKWVDVLRPTSDSSISDGASGGFASFTMMPYSNRIKEGMLTFEGKTHKLDINNDDGHRIHGDVRNCEWEVVKNTNNIAVTAIDKSDIASSDWPFAFEGGMIHEIDGKSLIITMSLKNLSDCNMPAGFGIHPYFVRKIGNSIEKVMLEAPLDGIYPGDTPIPTGTYVNLYDRVDFTKEKELTTEFLDNCFALSESTAKFTWPDAGVVMTMKADPIFKHVIIYCPQDDKRYFAFEPVTNCNDGFNMYEKGIKDTGTVVLSPGDELTGSIKFDFEW